MGSSAFRVKVCAALIAFGAVAACAEIDNIDYRSEIVNKGVSDYYNESILLNLIRASKSEPLAFASVSAVTGHNTVQGGVGLPSITVGPHTTAVPPAVVPARNFVFGPNTFTQSASNDFNLSVVDDPLSYAGLLAPVNPALIGFFINQGYSREILFFLFVDHIRLVDAQTGLMIEEYDNTPYSIQEYNAAAPDGRLSPSFQQANFDCFQNYLAYMIQEGLTAQVDVDAIPRVGAVPANRLCADTGMRVWFRQNEPAKFCKGLVAESNVLGPFRVTPLGRLKPTCSNATKWTVSEPATGSTTQKTGAGNQPSGAMTITATATATADVLGTPPTTEKSTTTVSPKQPKSGKGTKSSDSDAVLDACTGKAIPGTKVGNPRPWYELCLNNSMKVQVFLRSAYAVYQYLGQLIAKKMTISLYTGLQPDLNLLTITNNANYCFVSTSYKGEQYCVPTSAENTKRIFALLRQLVALNTAVQNQPATLTVRTTP